MPKVRKHILLSDLMTINRLAGAIKNIVTTRMKDNATSRGVECRLLTDVLKENLQGNCK